MKINFIETNNQEIWKRIQGYPDYQISNYGRVKSFRLKKERIMKGHFDYYGYLQLGLYVNGVQKTFTIHRLVALAFISNPENKKTVNHKDGNKINNHVDNLEWCTQDENIKHSWEIGLREGMRGEKNSLSRLNDKQVIEIRMLSKNLRGIKISKMFGVCNQTIYNILNGITWRHLK